MVGLYGFESFMKANLTKYQSNYPPDALSSTLIGLLQFYQQGNDASGDAGAAANLQALKENLISMQAYLTVWAR